MSSEIPEHFPIPVDENGDGQCHLQMSGDDLRTRIAATACDATSAGKLFPWDTLSPALREAWYEVADAIIRELGKG